MTAITRELARFVAQSKYDALPADVRHEGVRAFVNWVGCAAAGSQEEIVQRSLEVMTEFNGAPSSTLVGRPEKLDALNAAFINSMTSASLAFNDTHFATVAHPTSPVGATLLALAERQPVTGQDFVHAMVLGNEIQCRIGNILCTPPAECQIGLSMAGLVGCIGAAVAAGVVMGFDENMMATAIGLAADQSAGLREAHATMGSPFTQGHTARCGFMAALLASRGFTCNDTMIEGPKGFGHAFATQPQFDAALDKLGQSWEISTLAYKPYPCGFVIHPVIDACLEIAQKNSFDTAQIQRIELALNPLAIQLTNRPTPQNRSQSLVSLQHWAAVSLIYKAAGIAELADSVVHAPMVVALRSRIELVNDPTIAREAAIARVMLSDGTTLQGNVRDCRGSSGRPMTDNDLSVKTLGQLCIAFPEETAAKILAGAWKVAEYPLVGPFCAELGATA